MRLLMVNNLDICQKHWEGQVHKLHQGVRDQGRQNMVDSLNIGDVR